MFFQKKSILDSKLFNGFKDYHSHILPCVDDGSKSLEESLNILSWYEELGVEKVILTPHVMEDFPQNNAVFLRRKFEDFKDQYRGNIQLSLAAEYMLDSKFDKHFESHDLLTLFDNYLLVESSYIEPPLYFFEIINKIMQNGYFVVLAHPERYLFLSKEDYSRLKDMGVFFQMNILSILGGYGSSVAKNAQFLLGLSYYDFVGTDIHNIRSYKKYLSNTKLSKKVIGEIEKVANTNI